jgi:sterol desaturase/sphingolipid hydroxylase (fatty acid hydroxylase superfamily)
VGLASIGAVAALKFAVLFGLLLIVLAMELVRPMGTLAPWGIRAKGVLFTAIQVLGAVIFYALVARSLALTGFAPLGFFDIYSLAGGLASGIVIAYAHDFFYYWVHRAQHHFPILWRFHAVHHSIRHMSAPGGYGHVTEELFRALITFLPIAYLFRVETALVVTVGLMLHGAYIHSSTSIRFGRAAWLINDARCHRIHHSMEPEHRDKNFGSLTLIWDRLFGTAHFPRGNEWPEVGLEDQPHPATVSDFLFRPFRSVPGGPHVAGTNGSVGTV